jgi:hypothetical protein
MHKQVLALTVLTLAAAGTQAQTPTTERLVSPAVPGFIIGYQAANTQQSILEEVPRGESVQSWTRMITTQRFVGLARRATVAQYAQNIMNAVPRSCPGAVTSPLSSLTVSGRPAVRFQLDCPRSAGGKPETFILLAVAGASDIHVKQVAWRGGTTPAGLTWGRTLLAATAYCGAADRTPACRR